MLCTSQSGRENLNWKMKVTSHWPWKAWFGWTKEKNNKKKLHLCQRHTLSQKRKKVELLVSTMVFVYEMRVSKYIYEKEQTNKLTRSGKNKRVREKNFISRKKCFFFIATNQSERRIKQKSLASIKNVRRKTRNNKINVAILYTHIYGYTFRVYWQAVERIMFPRLYWPAFKKYISFTIYLFWMRFIQHEKLLYDIWFVPYCSGSDRE